MTQLDSGMLRSSLNRPSAAAKSRKFHGMAALMRWFAPVPGPQKPEPGVPYWRASLGSGNSPNVLSVSAAGKDRFPR